ncbi:dihydroxyacetone kinase transcriptional activator DhaS [Liquorilactobacillus nagelii]|uniref:dihydroxyacetone kinase transcriptional activator DhaS n=1 Tax=Liquorilactobacillus nagelii TaxID=82688 RepID=UPI0012ECE117|nr:dihydroxyacetone kinase transcriptional activator DhaS [Liquorilactobacillus nagelii]QYH54702.1 dihydroxyacetone kinase transcriptional activator DhaS [Liquorilactobacillus nagelii DSM 13675]
MTEIMVVANVRRQTFYDYFEDKYFLLNWFVNDSLTELIDNNLNYLLWEDIIKLTFFDIYYHKRFYLKCIKSQNEVNVPVVIANHFKVLINQLCQTMANSKEKENFTQTFSLGLANLLVDGLTTTNSVDYEIITGRATRAIRFIYDQFKLPQQNN